MVYGVCGSGHKVVEALTPLQTALAKVKNDASLETINKLVRNVAQNPSEEKFRKVRSWVLLQGCWAPALLARRAGKHCL